ncbi:hypothetical protein DHEL01_v211671 [Diaporthe helianthi]|uniref:Isotrichodermin C-15 hydroxylase n=1 Tax=Diaporthe helianthi TaxID=158607 RepID=A0A2P5HI68_DIAHE|nr:hypothetical protein DHEL01_v211671 [Diaporthe helianthi]
MAPSLNTILPNGIGNGNISTHNVLALAAGAAALFVVWRLAIIVYRLTLHPLAKYPGPKLYAATNLPGSWGLNVSGNLVRDSLDLHQKYGPIVRIAPDHLSVDGSIGWPQIFQHRPGKAEWSKVAGWYHPGDTQGLIGGTHDNHKRLRRQLNHAFSTESMYEQEPVVQKYMDLFFAQLSKKATTGEVFDIVPWYNFLTFDIIGDLTFADSFHNLDGGEYHPWVLGTFKAILGSGISRFTQRYPFTKPIFKSVSSSAESLKMEIQNRELANEKAMSRKAQGESPGGRKDFMTYMLKKTRDGQPGFSDLDLIMNSPLIVTAGSETTATTMAGFTFHLGLKENRAVYDRLARDIRAAFTDESEIDMKTTARVPYLTATIEETLRLYPPAAETPPRVSPGAELEGQYIPKGTLASIFQYSTYRNPNNFHDPNTMHPERWLPASHELYNPVFANDNKASFHPFSFGTRDCLGKNLAYSELRVAIARLLFRFDFELAPGQEDWQDKSKVLIVWEKGPLHVKLTERKLVPVN